MTQPLREKDVGRLLRGISTNHVETVRSAWRRLLVEPEIAVPLVLDKLDTKAWQRKPVGPSSHFLGVLFTLLHELDAEAFTVEVTRLQAEPLHAFHKHTVNLMAKRYADRVFGVLAGGVPVYIAEDIAKPDMVFNYLEQWSKTPDLAISTVTRVDVIALRDEMDYRGLYCLLYDSIVLAWPEWDRRQSYRWLNLMRAEMTFYHEVGHHFHQHKEGGQIKQQEREANQYSARMFRKAHPMLVPLIKTLLLPMWLLKKFKRFALRRESEFEV